MIANLLLLVLSTPSFATDADFPLRAEYAGVPWITTDDLAARYHSVVVVDVRSEFEFDVIHIANAKHLPVAKASFIADVGSLVEEDMSSELVFYCNGHTCAKSYKATKKALDAGYSKATAYDAGVFEWTTAHPDRSVLLGDSPVDPTQIISAESLAAHTLDSRAFEVGVAKSDTRLIDMREPIQRKKTPDFAGKKPANYYSKRLVELLKQDSFKKSSKGKVLYFYDAVGKQVRWLQYHLEAEGYEDYYFLEGGVWSIFGADGAN